MASPHYLVHILCINISFRIQESIDNEEIEVLKLLNQRYFQNDNISEDLNLLEVLITDSVHVTSTNLFALQAAKYAQSSVYQYHYSHTGSLCLAEIQNLTFWQILAKVKNSLYLLPMHSFHYIYVRKIFFEICTMFSF